MLANLAGRRITIVGLAREGTALARVLVQAGAKVLVTDAKPASALQENLARLEGLPIAFALGGHPPSVLEADLLFLSPGVPLDAPIVQAARQAQVPLSTETRLFMELCPAPIVGISGSSGKTTTTSLVGEMCRAAGRKTWVGGNIGQPLIGQVQDIRPEDAVVMELSSFQLELYAPWPTSLPGASRFPRLAQGKSAHIGAILNIAPNHLDRHGTMADYIAAKGNLIHHQSPRDFAILNANDPVTWGLAAKTAGRVLGFSLQDELEEGAFVRQGRIVVRRAGGESMICQTQDMQLVGRHNLANVLAACAIASTAGLTAGEMAAAITRFTGVEHRLEQVREMGGARYYNDSIATSPERAMAALRSFDAPIVLLAGGRDKHLPWDAWADLVAEKVKHVLLFGESAVLIQEATRRAWAGRPGPLPPVEQCGSLEAAVARATQIAGPGDVVLLSPGGTSFDAYRDFEERGRAFKALINGIDEGDR